VRLGVNKVSGQQVAVKFVNTKMFAKSGDCLRETMKEISALKQVSFLTALARAANVPCGQIAQIDSKTNGHPSLLKFLGAYHDHAGPNDSERLMIVTQLCKGGDLFDQILKSAQKGTLYTEAQVAKIFAQLFLGLKAMHESGQILHCDLKNENFLLVSDDVSAPLVIADFGMAQEFSGSADEVCRGPKRGTWGYMAPELLSHREISVKSDSWAMGVALYISLKAALPYDPARIQRYGAGAITQYPIDTSAAALGLSEAAASLLGHLLDIDSSTRFSPAQALAHPFLANEAAASTESLDLRKLKGFRARMRLKAAASAVTAGSYMNHLVKLRHLVAGVDVADMRHDEMRSAFMRASREDDGSTAGMAVGMTAFKRVLQDLGMGALPAEQMFAVLDDDGNGEVDFKEFMCGLALLQGPSEKALKMCFKICDTDGSGSLCPEEMGTILRNLATGDMDQDTKQADALAHVFETLDVDGDGEISWEEFRTGVNRDPFLVNALLRPIQHSTSRRKSFKLLLARADTVTPTSSPPPGQVSAGAAVAPPLVPGAGPDVAVIMGSDSDLPCMRAGLEVLEQFGVRCEVTVVSAHRTPEHMMTYAKAAAGRGIKTIIAAAGGAAHLPGMTAALTTLPVIGVPVPLKHLDGVDSLHSIVQMPRGVPVATVGIGNSTNAALLAVRILSITRPKLAQQLQQYAAESEAAVLKKAEKLEQSGWKSY